MNALRYNPRFIFIDLSKKQGTGPLRGPLSRPPSSIGSACRLRPPGVHRPANNVAHSTTQNSGVAGRGGARGGEYGLRNYECFPSSQLPHAKMLPPEGNAPHAKCSRWKAIYLPHAKCSRRKAIYLSHAKCSPGKETRHMRNAPPREGIHFPQISC